MNFQLFVLAKSSMQLLFVEYWKLRFSIKLLAFWTVTSTVLDPVAPSLSVAVTLNVRVSSLFRDGEVKLNACESGSAIVTWVPVDLFPFVWGYCSITIISRSCNSHGLVNIFGHITNKVKCRRSIWFYVHESLLVGGCSLVVFHCHFKSQQLVFGYRGTLKVTCWELGFINVTLVPDFAATCTRLFAHLDRLRWRWCLPRCLV